MIQENHFIAYTVYDIARDSVLLMFGDGGSSNSIKENIDLRGEIKIEKEGRWHICKARNQ